MGFSIGTKGYIGTGISDGGISHYQDFWEWDQVTNVWTEKTNFKGDARSYAVCVSIGNKAYIGTGAGLGINDNGFQDFWEYDPTLK